MLELLSLDSLRVGKGRALAVHHSGVTATGGVFKQQQRALTSLAQLLGLVREGNRLSSWHVAGKRDFDQFFARHVERVDGCDGALVRRDHLFAYSESVEGLSPKLLALDRHIGVHLLEIVIDFADGTTRQAIMELVEQQRLPDGIELLLGYL